MRPTDILQAISPIELAKACGGLKMADKAARQGLDWQLLVRDLGYVRAKAYVNAK